MPSTPAAISTASATAQNSTTLPTCSRRRPWRSTKAFCAPMATISPRLSSQALDEDGSGERQQRVGQVMVRELASPSRMKANCLSF
jgi:hypothetical protein